MLFWVEQGVRTFRVDNPHTKPFDFWQWLIREAQDRHPEVVFLAEAFTRPKIMQELAKTGFTQSYTYFTWRNSKEELTQYFRELTTPPMVEYFRGNLFVNTPDILSEVLQRGGRPAFKMRAALAATLSSLWGMYSGFELCENLPVKHGSEENTRAPRSTRSASVTGRAPATSRITSGVSTRSVGRIRRSRPTGTCASTRPTAPTCFSTAR